MSNETFIQRIRKYAFNEFSLFLPRRHYNRIRGTYRYTNAYVDSNYMPTYGYIKIVQYKGHLSLVGGFSDPQITPLPGNYVTMWSSSFAEIKDRELHYKYLLHHFNDGIKIREVPSDAILSIITLADNSIELEEKFTNPLKGPGSCKYVSVSRWEYFKKRRKFLKINPYVFGVRT